MPKGLMGKMQLISGIAKLIEEKKYAPKVTMELSADEALIIEGYRALDEGTKGEALFAFAAEVYVERIKGGESHGQN